MFPLDTKCWRRRDRHRRCDDGSADLGSTDLDSHCWILRPRDRPIRDNTSRAAAVLWFRPQPTDVSSRMSGASGRCLRPSRWQAAAYPRIGRHERCWPRARSLCLIGVVAVRCRQHRRRYRRQPTWMGPTRLSRGRSSPSQALVWSQSRYRGARMRLPGDLDRRSIPSEDTAHDR